MHLIVLNTAGSIWYLIQGWQTKTIFIKANFSSKYETHIHAIK